MTSRSSTNARNATIGSDAPTVVSTFAGCGGSSLGYKWAGFRELLAIDFDDNAVETFRANFPEIPIWKADMTKMEPKGILEFSGLKPGELDTLDGSPPCQGFSTAGKRRVSDGRNELFLSFVKLLAGLKPKTFVMENVAGMCTGRMKGTFLDVVEALGKAGYAVKCRKMNAMWYGVPQSRERLIFLGVRNDLSVEPSFPLPTAEFPVSAANALKGVDNSAAEIVKPSDSPLFGTTVSAMAKRLKQGENGQKVAGVGKGFGLRRLRADRPSYTITKTFSTSMSAGLLHPTEDRYLTIPELKRLASFPDDFIFVGKFQEQWARIGNAVMPRFMEAIARHVRVEILKR